MIRRSLLAASAVLLIAGSAAAQTPGASPSNPPPPPAAPTTAVLPFLALAAQGDVYEITSSQLAVMRSQNPSVKRFATMLIDHHSRTTNVALTQAKAAGIMPAPPVLGPQKRSMIDALIAAGAADFDRVYLQQQIPAHEEALALHTTYAASGDTPQLRTAAAGAVPIVRQHLEEVRRMAMMP